MIYLNIKKKYRSLGTKRVERFTRKVLSLLRLTQSDLGLVLTSDKDIRRYNRKYLNHDRPTDVLAFGYGEKRTPSPSRARTPVHLGDIMVSVDRAKIQSKQYGNKWEEELELYIVHGILHLLGYDDHRPHDRLRMRKKEQHILKRIRQK